jgi:hypothetical protein
VPTATKGLVSIAVAIAAPDEKLQKKKELRTILLPIFEPSSL